MAERKECKHYGSCKYRIGTGECPTNCIQFRHEDDVRVTRCKDCIYYDAETGTCEARLNAFGGSLDVGMYDYCSDGDDGGKA